VKDFLTAIGLVLVIEGVIFALSPTHLRDALRLIERVPDKTITTMGIGAMLTGVLLVGIVKSLF
jgi:uncharacterized protein